jgi:isopenicillin-N N-acyltransferase-like protein
VRPPEIPLLRVAGSHRQVGRAIGEATAEVVRGSLEGVDAATIAAAEPYREVTVRELPNVVEELDGVAAGAGVDPQALFAASIEELIDRYSGAAQGRCSDLGAVAPATPDGHVWVAHNNDLPAHNEQLLVAIERRAPGEPTVFTIGLGPWLSVGFNSAGLSLTGNELSPNDNRVGIPRLLQVRDIVGQPTLDAALRSALNPARASSYNNLLAHRDGGMVNVEGSATDAELTRPGADGTLAHTNHYVCSRMLRFEGDPSYAEHSEVRYRRALTWLAPGHVTADLLRDALCDHTGGADALCRHVEAGATSKTVFWCIADVTKGRVSFGRGNPCNSIEQVYEFG